MSNEPFEEIYLQRATNSGREELGRHISLPRLSGIDQVANTDLTAQRPASHIPSA